MKQKTLGAIVLAAGKGKRMNSKRKNKVTFPLGNRPMILHAVNLLEAIEIGTIIVVVGFAKKSVVDVLRDTSVIFAEQRKRLGTAHACSRALLKLPRHITDVLVLQGDDSAFYKQEILKKLIESHISSRATLTFLTLALDNPFGLGRVVRDALGQVASVVEEKDATEKQRLISEINPACYLFQVKFLRKYLKKIKKSSITGEYYLTNLIGIAIKNKEKVETVKIKGMPWRGVNTEEELKVAEKLFQVYEKDNN
ncbi:MAG: sugar phosphate nucleotidyltransferase [bacterium]|nr:sugar phosphate nucleotidyltransferase [bacterium]